VSTPARSSPPKRTIRIPEEVARDIEERIRGSGFESVDSFVSFVLARLLEHPVGETPFSEEEERQIKDRLRSLGYID
jgi:Arc/MetJ-type ribon-helix-helix transcriptional regulator